jgi:DNA-binding transcriptional MerR regulator
MLTINAVATMLHVSVDFIRRAERLGLIPRASRTPGGHRRWSPSDLDFIRAALTRGVAIVIHPRARGEQGVTEGKTD